MEAASIDGAVDCDLALCPVTNSMPILRLGLLETEHAADAEELATSLERAVDETLVATPPPDAGGGATTIEFSDAVLERLQLQPAG